MSKGDSDLATLPKFNYQDDINVGVGRENDLEAAPEEDEPNNEADSGECFGEIDTVIQKVFCNFLSLFLFVTNKIFSFGKL
jgi:hypothetical protein